MPNMFQFICDIPAVIKKRGLEDNGKVQQFIDSECLRLCEPKVPKRENILIESGHLNTVIGSGQIKYRTPYARRWYYMPAKFHEAPERGNYWFERMKQQYKEKILSGAKKIASRNNNPVTMDARPVLAPAPTPAELSTNVVVVDVPRIAPAEVAIASAISACFTFGSFPSSSNMPALSDTPISVPIVSNIPVCRYV